jgi:hypothetical protein
MYRKRFKDNLDRMGQDRWSKIPRNYKPSGQRLRAR